MNSDYGSLRRRTREGSWQWLMIGMVLGLGMAMVACVAGYAFGALTFPALENDTPTPGAVSDVGAGQAQIEPNQTAVAATWQAATAQSALQTANAQQTAPAMDAGADGDAAGSPAPAQSPTPGDLVTPAAAANITTTPEQTALPAADTPGATTAPAPDVAAAGGDQGGDAPPVGTQPASAPTPTVFFPDEGSDVPAELQAIQTELVPVTGGMFQMGTLPEEGKDAVDECAIYDSSCELAWVQDAIPAHQVTVDSFQMETYEVLLAQYVVFLNWKGPESHKTGCQGKPCAETVLERPNLSYIDYDGTTYSVRNASIYSTHPVTLVTWWGADEYCRTIGRRLPTEAEWERAARGSQNSIYPWGNDFDPARANSSRSGADGTEPVETYPNGASEYGVYNLAGNVAEWVSDWYQQDYYQLPIATEPNPMGPPTSPIGEKVIRGGSWDTVPLFLRSVHRMSADPGLPSTSVGFRCVADTSAPVAPVVPADATPAGDGAVDSAPTLGPPPTSQPVPTAGPSPTLNPG